MTTKNYKVSDMDCGTCAMHIESLEDEMPGIDAIKVSYKKQTMEVTFDEHKTSPDEINRRVKALGYGLVEAEPTNKKGLFSWINK